MLWDSISAKTRIKLWKLTMDAGVVEVFTKSKEVLDCPMTDLDALLGGSFAEKVFKPIKQISGQLNIQNQMRDL